MSPTLNAWQASIDRCSSEVRSCLSPSLQSVTSNAGRRLQFCTKRLTPAHGQCVQVMTLRRSNKRVSITATCLKARCANCHHRGHLSNEHATVTSAATGD